MNITSAIEKAKPIVYEMLKDRKYTKIVEEDDNIIIADDKLLVFFSKDQKINKDNIQTFTSRELQTRNISHGIFVYPNSITSTAKNIVLQNRIDNIHIELFYIINLQYNITKHRLVPKHQKLQGEEYKEIKTKFGKSLPRIYITDPIVRYYNFDKGDILKIFRNTSNGQLLMAYRIIV